MPEIFHCAELTVLERSDGIAEWVRLAEEEPGEVSAQSDAVRRAQRIAELPVAAKKIVWLASCRR